MSAYVGGAAVVNWSDGLLTCATFTCDGCDDFGASRTGFTLFPVMLRTMLSVSDVATLDADDPYDSGDSAYDDDDASLLGGEDGRCGAAGAISAGGARSASVGVSGGVADGDAAMTGSEAVSSNDVASSCDGSSSSRTVDNVEDVSQPGAQCSI